MGRIGFITDNEGTENDFPHYDFIDGVDMTVLGDGIIFPAHCDNNNGNELIIGTTGSGKSMSVVEPRIAHTYNSSLIIPVVKRHIVDIYKPLLKSRNYDIVDLDLTNPKRVLWDMIP